MVEGCLDENCEGRKNVVMFRMRCTVSTARFLE